MSGDGWIRGPQWASPEAEAEWSDRLAAAAKAWEELETMSVTSGLRPSALVFLSPEELLEATRACEAAGLRVVPLSWDGGSIRAAVCPPALAIDWLAAWRMGNDTAIGALLGFPQCCVDFFRRVWVEERQRDTTPHMAQALADGPLGANIMLRRLGVRMVPHLPCSFECAASGELGRQMLRVARDAGLEDAVEIERLLGLPMRWDACNGAAVVEVGGLFRFAYETDRTDRHVTLTRRGGLSPGMEPPPWRDNGFNSRAAMVAAHEVVTAVALARGPEAIASAIDLGAGDGALLEQISAKRTGSWAAVEMDGERCARGRRRRPGLRFVEGRIEEVAADPILTVAGPADAALLMPGRLAEMDPDARARVKAALPDIARRLVVYAYSDWLKDGGLARVFIESGLPGRLGPVASGPGVEAAEVTWN